MPVETRSSHPSDLWPGIEAHFGTTYDQWPAEWSQMFEQRTASMYREDIVEGSGYGFAPVKGEGNPYQYDIDAEGVKTSFYLTAYGLATMVTKEALEDNLYASQGSSRAKKLANSMNVTTEIVHANVFNRGFNANFPGGDGQPFFSTAHPTRAGTFANTPTVAADLTEASLEDAFTNIRRFTDARGLPVKIQAKKLIVAPGAEFNAIRITKSELRSGTADNDLNVIRAQGLLPGGVMVGTYLMDNDAWFLTTGADQGLLSFWKVKPDVQQDNDFDTDNARFKSRMRFSCGWADPRCAYGSPGA